MIVECLRGLMVKTLPSASSDVTCLGTNSVPGGDAGSTPAAGIRHVSRFAREMRVLLCLVFCLDLSCFCLVPVLCCPVLSCSVLCSCLVFLSCSVLFVCFSCCFGLFCFVSVLFCLVSVLFLCCCCLVQVLRLLCWFCLVVSCSVWCFVLI